MTDKPFPGETHAEAQARALVQSCWTLAKQCASFAVGLSEAHDGDHEEVREYIEENREDIVNSMPPQIAIHLMWVLEEVFGEKEDL